MRLNMMKLMLSLFVFLVIVIITITITIGVALRGLWAVWLHDPRVALFV